MKKILLISMVFIGCKETVPERPYIITGKRCDYSCNNCEYYMVSKDGQRIGFDEPCTNYTIGDTIK